MRMKHYFTLTLIRVKADVLTFNVEFSAQDFDHYQLVNKPLWVDYQDGKISATQLQNTRFEMWAENWASPQHV